MPWFSAHKPAAIVCRSDAQDAHLHRRAWGAIEKLGFIEGTTDLLPIGHRTHDPKVTRRPPYKSNGGRRGVAKLSRRRDDL
jgi:hypothetical protein